MCTTRLSRVRRVSVLVRLAACTVTKTPTSKWMRVPSPTPQTEPLMLARCRWLPSCDSTSQSLTSERRFARPDLLKGKEVRVLDDDTRRVPSHADNTFDLEWVGQVRPRSLLVQRCASGKLESCIWFDVDDLLLLGTTPRWMKHSRAMLEWCLASVWETLIWTSCASLIESMENTFWKSFIWWLSKKQRSGNEQSRLLQEEFTVQVTGEPRGVCCRQHGLVSTSARDDQILEVAQRHRSALDVGSGEGSNRVGRGSVASDVCLDVGCWVCWVLDTRHTNWITQGAWMVVTEDGIPRHHDSKHHLLHMCEIETTSVGHAGRWDMGTEPRCGGSGVASSCAARRGVKGTWGLMTGPTRWLLSQHWHWEIAGWWSRRRYVRSPCTMCETRFQQDDTTTAGPRSRWPSSPTLVVSLVLALRLGGCHVRRCPQTDFRPSWSKRTGRWSGSHQDAFVYSGAGRTWTSVPVFSISSDDVAPRQGKCALGLQSSKRSATVDAS